MSANAEASLAPFFIDGTRGRLFALEVAPPRDVEPELSVLLCPPFAEEINRTRRAVQLAARRMAAHGCCVLLLDLHGTGDSEGDFGEARWPDWREDLARGVEWLRLHRSSRVALFGVRLGAMLALELASRLDCERVLLWQPVAKGAQFLTQFLRLRVASDMLAADAASSTDALRSELRAGRSVEIAGYTIAPELAAGLDQLDLERLACAESPPIEWIDAVSSPERPLAPASRSVIEHWRAAGVRVSAQTCVAPAFWNTPEIVVPTSFIEATARIAGEWAGAGVAA